MTLRSLKGAALLSCIVLAQAAQAADPGCWRPEELRAARLQSLQHALMVDTLKCQDTLPATVASYNAFLGKRRDMLVQNKYAVQAHFVRLLGPVEGMKAAANFDTQVGNRLSAGGIDVKRCETTGLYARLATEAGEDDLLMMATMLAGGGPLAPCVGDAPAAAVVAAPAAMVIPVWKKPIPAAAAAPASAVAVAPAVAAGPLPTGDTAALIAAVRREKALKPAAAPVPAPTPALVPASAPAVVPAVAALPAPAPARIAVASLTPPDPGAERARTDALRALQAAAAALTQAAESMRPAEAVPLGE